MSTDVRGALMRAPFLRTGIVLLRAHRALHLRALRPPMRAHRDPTRVDDPIRRAPSSATVGRALGLQACAPKRREAAIARRDRTAIGCRTVAPARPYAPLRRARAACGQRTALALRRERQRRGRMRPALRLVASSALLFVRPATLSHGPSSAAAPSPSYRWSWWRCAP